METINFQKQGIAAGIDPTKIQKSKLKVFLAVWGDRLKKESFWIFSQISKNQVSIRSVLLRGNKCKRW